MVALLSYHFWYNYGTCFQAYALWKCLKEEGIESEYIDIGWKYPIPLDLYLTNHWIYQRPGCSYVYIIRHFTRCIKSAIRQRKLSMTAYVDYVLYSNNKKFDSFHRHYIKESQPYDTEVLATIESKYQMFIVGSDQVWNPNNCDKKYYVHFLLDFVKDFSKKISYASSIGVTEVSKEYESLLFQYLKDFSHISCREKTGKELLENLLNKKVEHVLDPTLLLTADKWRKLAKYDKRNDAYIMCYILGDKQNIVEFAMKLARKKGRDLVIVTATPSIIMKYSSYIATGIGPREFIGLLSKCSCFITDSFHGTVFAINFNKNFYSFMKRSGDYYSSDNSRIPDILRQFNLLNRLIENDTTFFSDEEIDFTEANLILEKERHKSKSYLLNCLIEKLQ